VNGWLVSQLPGVLGQNALAAAFAGAAEGVGNSLRQQADAIEHQLDPDLASPAMLTFLASWLGFPLDRFDDPDFHRPLLRTVGRLHRLRGTKAALTELLMVLTGGPVTVSEAGGVFGPGVATPAYDPVVRVQLSQAGPLGQERVLAIIRRELPIGVRLELMPIGGGDGSKQQS
jgi:phage tail-like protein